MKADRKILARAITACLKAVSSRPGIPALTGILTEVGDGEATLTATDLETTIRVPVAVATEQGESWTALVPARIFADVLKASKSAEAEVFVREQESRVYIDGTALRLLPAEDFPAPPTPSAFVSSVEAGEFRAAIEAVLPAASGDYARPVLAGVLLEASARWVNLTATDSYRLHHAEVPARGTEQKAIVPATALKALATMIGKRGAGALGIGISEVLVAFRLGDGRELSARLVEGEYPNWRQLVPVSTKEGGFGELLYDREALLEVLKRAEPFAKHSPVRLALGPQLEDEHPALDSVTVMAIAPDVGQFEAEVRLASWRGDDSLNVAFDPTYLRDAISATGGDVLYIRDGLKPVLATGPDRLALVMPVRMPSPIESAVPRMRPVVGVREAS